MGIHDQRKTMNRKSNKETKGQLNPKRLLYLGVLLLAALAWTYLQERPDTGEELALKSSEPQPSTPITEGGVRTYGVGFYNVENLYDTTDDPKVNDEDFLPDGQYAWDQKKYTLKIANISRVLSELGADGSSRHEASLIGLAEVENRGVVEDLLAHQNLRKSGYRILHYDSPDRRGIDCALLYHPEDYRLTDSLYVPYIFPSARNPQDNLGFSIDPATRRVKARKLFGDTSKKTRGFLVAIGELAGQPLSVIVCHWPSRGSESDTREQAGYQVRKLREALLVQYPGMAFVIMGDLNDDPDNKSLSRSLQTRYTPKEAAGNTAELYNPWRYTLREEGRGTLTYKGEWNLFDQIIVSGNLVSPQLGQQQGHEADDVTVGTELTMVRHEIFNPEYIQETEAKYRGNPLRTHVGTRWMKGYSDHFPTYILLSKRQ